MLFKAKLVEMNHVRLTHSNLFKSNSTSESINFQINEWIPVFILKIFDYVSLNFRLLLLRRNTVSYLQL